MPSPFPGMDPYIEAAGLWGDFHGGLIASLRAQLNGRLPRGFAANIELYVWFEEPDNRRRRRIEPDVYVSELDQPRRRSPGQQATLAPRTIVLPAVGRRRHKYLQVVDLKSNRVVTVIEVLSPGNKKSGEERDVYLAKRTECLASGISFVEIDLLRGGSRLPLSIPRTDVEDYYIMVCKAWEFPRAGFWSLTIRDPLPDVPIPLVEDVRAIDVPLQQCVDESYASGRYGDRLPYGKPLRPRLGKKDAEWVREIVTAESS